MSYGLSAFFWRFFNKNTFLFCLAIAIPTLLIMFWNYANNTARTTVASAKTEMDANPNQDNIKIDDYELKEITDSTQLKWILNASKGVMNPITKDVDLQSVHVDYFDGTKIKMRITGPIGKANELTKKIEIYATKEKRVEAIGEDGKAKLLAAKVELVKNNQFLATGGVNIVWPNVARVDGDHAEGSLKSTDLKNFKIIGQTHALIGGQGAPPADGQVAAAKPAAIAISNTAKIAKKTQ